MVLRFLHVKRELLSHRLSKAKALGLWIPRPLSYPLTLQFGVLLDRQDCNVATICRASFPCMKAPSQQETDRRGVQKAESGLCLTVKPN